jgi:hypothetical protein
MCHRLRENLAAGYGRNWVMGMVVSIFAVKHFCFSFLIDHENPINRICVHPRHPRNPCS